MPSTPLKSTRSAHNPLVTLITSTTPIKQEPTELPETPAFLTPSRRSTRPKATSTKHALDPSSSTHAIPSPSPRKKPKLETPLTPKTPSSSDRPTTPKSSSKKPFPRLSLEKPHPAPLKWEEQYRLIERMRRGIIAPVDDMPGERPRITSGTDPKTLRFHTLISLMLSSQTKDPVTSQAVTNLHHTLPGGLTASSLASASIDQIHECISKVGFWRRKTEYIQEAARSLLSQQGEARGDVPKTLEGLCELKGVGPKMAFLTLQCAWDINAGIGVDVHVHRITNRLKWHKPPTVTPEQTRLNLQSWLPSHLHKPINPMMVGFGQVICLPVGPRCDVCLLGQRKICPSRVTNVKAEGRKEVLYTFTAEDGDFGNIAKVEVKYEEDGLERMKEESKENGGLTQEEMIEEPGMGEEAVLEVLDRIEGVAETEDEAGSES